MALTYYTITEVFDFGPHINKVILEPDFDLSGIALSPSQFTVSVKRTSRQGEDFVWPAFMGAKPDDSMKGNRQVTAAYVSDRMGNKTENGSFITLELACHPMDGLGSIIRFDGTFNVFVDFQYRIEQTASASADDKIPQAASSVTDNVCAPHIYDIDGGNSILLGDLLQTGEHPHATDPLRYSCYIPALADGEKIPLIIWLHGAGEGGQDTLIAAIGNKVVNLISPKMQAYFGGKAMLLAPQCPTMWMDDGTGEYTQDGSSKYVDALESLIADFVDEHPEVDRSRIYIGGDSNGGFMTMKMIIHNPSRYAAAFPVCEALHDKTITDADIQKIQSVPIWFTHSKDDPVVAPDEYVVPTYKRLVAAGNPDVHFTYWDTIEDLSGLYKMPDGTPFRYVGHWSWIHMLNNDCKTDFDEKPVLVDGKPVSIVEWIASHRISQG